MMTRENMLDHHIHLHIHEIMPGRWLRPRSRIQARIFSNFLYGVLLGMGIMGVLWFQWWRWRCQGTCRAGRKWPSADKREDSQRRQPNVFLVKRGPKTNENFIGLRFDRFRGKMNRDELATALNVLLWDVDDWLLWGCPAKKFRTAWEFDLEKVKIWLEGKKITIKRIRPQQSPTKPTFDRRWFKGRCPICFDRGVPGEKAGKVYTLGEVLEDGEWHLRRTGIPCGHSACLRCKWVVEIKNLKTIWPKSWKRGSEVNVNKKRFLEVLEAGPELRKDKIVVLKKAITEGTYQVKADLLGEW